MLVLSSRADNPSSTPPILERRSFKTSNYLGRVARRYVLIRYIGHFADHPLVDIIEMIACQFTVRHIRGGPRLPVWYPGFPLYVHDLRYNDRERIFVEIRNRNSCVPEEVREGADFMPIYPSEAPVFPRRYLSPFFTGGHGTGGLEESVEKAEGDRHEGGRIGRKWPRKAATGTATVVQPSIALQLVDLTHALRFESSQHSSDLLLTYDYSCFSGTLHHHPP